MNDVVTGADIATGLTLELGAAGAFLEILQQEQAALVEGRIERLEALAADKSRMVAQLAELADRRNRHLAALGMEPDLRGMETWLADTKAAATWRELLQLAQTVHQLNQTNGAIIDTRLKHNQQALAALLSAAGSASLYGPQGQTLGYSGGRPLAQV